MDRLGLLCRKDKAVKSIIWLIQAAFWPLLLILLVDKNRHFDEYLFMG
jgi:hypothetical protein